MVLAEKRILAAEVAAKEQRLAFEAAAAEDRLAAKVVTEERRLAAEKRKDNLEKAKAVDRRKEIFLVSN